ncbi:hypothetical protein LGI69_000127 [Salmonella enterica]|uniref:Uncharacterized protein n=2 Tax=Salmonella enterica TaxID=28901 RepID=A0A735RFL9_SALDZ|nr:hypothetical protein [Salmonella enterica]EBP3537538.1 hypothetical protein [Salmonella enterica subsp. enterica]ECC1574220.1 hypothetical protein [Salmonella enterica subsp. diarizonae]ECO1513306.1 hypothetical protein [Salmonella enterica subsp. arizonae]EGE5261094.1 hypothetical protein [Salmonella enterica subsp. diarizonae serovar 38:k:z]MJY21181.1 hypothetical protein [Salmonella enterica subsp. enterica serovar Enteritidis]HCM1893128.1 hypothetical protein [Salmonella enterica subsp
MKINNGPVLCPHCGCLSAYYEIDRLAAIREKVNKEGGSKAWDSTLQEHKKKAFCLMCHKSINEAVIGQSDAPESTK